MLSVTAPLHYNKKMKISMMILSVLRPNAEHGACILMSRVFILNVVMLNVVVPKVG